MNSFFTSLKELNPEQTADKLVVLIDEHVADESQEIFAEQARAAGLQVVVADCMNTSVTNDMLAVIVQNPNVNGAYEDLSGLAAEADRAEAEVLVLTDPLSETLLTYNGLNVHSLMGESSFANREEAERAHSWATYLNEMLQAYGFAQENTYFVDTLRIAYPDDKSEDELRELAEELDVPIVFCNGYMQLQLRRVDTLDTMNACIEYFATLADCPAPYVEDEDELTGLWTLEEEMVKG